jgi:hypothetical protein
MAGTSNSGSFTGVCVAWRRLAGDTARAATTDEVKQIRREAQDLKEVVAEQAFEAAAQKNVWRAPFASRFDTMFSPVRRRVSVCRTANFSSPVTK